MFWFGRFYCKIFSLKISSYIKSHPPPPPPIATKTILSERLNPWRNWGGGGTRSKLKLIKYVSTEEKDDILEELDLSNLSSDSRVRQTSTAHIFRSAFFSCFAPPPSENSLKKALQ